MRKILITSVMLCFAVAGWGQDTSGTNSTSTSTGKDYNLYGISFVVGLGGVRAFKDYYQMPVIDPIDKFVHISQAQPAGLNASLGIVYTPYEAVTKSGKYVPKNISYAAFFNPLNIMSNTNKIQDNFSLDNFGIGIGYKTLSGLSIFATLEAFSIKQPRQWVVEKFSDNKTQYIINTNGTPQIQTSIDQNDNNIFEKKYILGIGLKICYTFDIINNFSSEKR